MNKVFKYLFVLAMVFVLFGNNVFAEETDVTFDHIDIDKTVVLKYIDIDLEKNITNTLDSSLVGIKLYTLDNNNSDKRNEITINLSDVYDVEDVIRINGCFYKYYDDNITEVIYLIEYTFVDNDKIIIYKKEYTFSSLDNKSTDEGLLIKIRDNKLEDIEIKYNSDGTDLAASIDSDTDVKSDPIESDDGNRDISRDVDKRESEYVANDYVVVFSYDSNKYLMANNGSVSLNSLLNDLNINISFNNIRSVKYSDKYFTMLDKNSDYILTNIMFVVGIDDIDIMTNDNVLYKIIVNVVNKSNHADSLTDNVSDEIDFDNTSSVDTEHVNNGANILDVSDVSNGITNNTNNSFIVDEHSVSDLSSGCVASDNNIRSFDVINDSSYYGNATSIEVPSGVTTSLLEVDTNSSIYLESINEQQCTDTLNCEDYIGERNQKNYTGKDLAINFTNIDSNDREDQIAHKWDFIDKIQAIFNKIFHAVRINTHNKRSVFDLIVDLKDNKNDDFYLESFKKIDDHLYCYVFGLICENGEKKDVIGLEKSFILKLIELNKHAIRSSEDGIYSYVLRTNTDVYLNYSDT